VNISSMAKVVDPSALGVSVPLTGFPIWASSEPVLVKNPVRREAAAAHTATGSRRYSRRKSISSVHGIGKSDFSFGRTCWSDTFNKIVVAA